MADSLDTLALGGGVLSVGLALYLISRGLRAPSRWVLGGILLNFGILTTLDLIPRYLGGQWIEPMRVTLFLLNALFITLNLAFAVVFPAIALSPMRRFLLVVAALPWLFIAFFVITDPSLVPQPGGLPTGFDRLVNLLLVASHLPALWVFGRYWLSSPASSYRSQFLYVLVPYLLWNATDAVYAVVTTFQHPEIYGFALLGTAFTLSLLQGFGVAIIGLGSLLRAASTAQDVWREDLRLVLLLLLAVPLTILLFAVRNGPYLVNGLIMPLLFFGGARFQIPDLYVRLKGGVAATVIGATALTILFIVEEVVQMQVGAVVGRRAGGLYGILGGLLVAGVTVVAFAPLRRVARRLSNRLVPGVEGDSSYWTERRLHLYRVALEGVMRDKSIEPSEARALAALREQLRVSLREHQALEAALRGAPVAEFTVARRVRF